MSNPKFHVGQRVAVCTPSLRFVIPETTVVSVRFDEAEICWRSVGYKQAPADWYYQVLGLEINPRNGRHLFFRERYLRPIDPDTEYREEEQEQAA